MTIKEFREKSWGIYDMTIWYDNNIVNFEDYKNFEIEELWFEEENGTVIVNIYLKNS